ncbi:magnesium/cobalt transport protein CorA, putative [Entamoeba histolytica HM-1:IMSS-B]|uniref:Magnesium and cobalt transport protein CorA, putative n=6 Tax=Entamoeba histolytica TaxID=5759 RepID=C4M3B7_ENTH1|nr:magnesium and cobalt transport protein CorA, putative [Entamoeba histolytica HM-1:IMSS]EMD48212.1 magnesium and cobalt transport protein CorA, putative [Entamoeba histolytica KU27]EMH73435.1 magnesium/cobalt transport protein CorA, putative [Entamoeba histolytica HM-1:IMSS-B]EMS15542.1 magnesium and cobalt transport protein CorA, putative [Entamoeba histolytica HM-3:IMSS]ENY63882.1 magnesium and cobalt transport protein CorA, putative [Entamoeba histolytica HM-1:IMSS-A]GAT95800.1 magnesium |eukprot:XP_649345.1 magnesium and cobalt transport protein CorA, putative [Entamoeba histolytica HM-1:IMSS]
MSLERKDDFLLLNEEKKIPIHTPTPRKKHRLIEDDIDSEEEGGDDESTSSSSSEDEIQKKKKKKRIAIQNEINKMKMEIIEEHNKIEKEEPIGGIVINNVINNKNEITNEKRKINIPMNIHNYKGKEDETNKFLRQQQKKFDQMRLNTPDLTSKINERMKINKNINNNKIDEELNDYFPPCEKVIEIGNNESIWNSNDQINIIGERINKTIWNIQQLKNYCIQCKNSNVKIENHFLWIDISNPSKEVMVAIGLLFHLHFLSLQRWLDEDQREAVLIYPQYYEILIKNTEYQPLTDLLKIKNTRITIKKKIIITFHQKHDRVFDIVKVQNVNPKECNPELVLFEILHQSIMQFADWVRIINDETEIQQSMQFHVLKKEQLGFIARSDILEKKIDTILSCLQSKKTMLKFLIRSSHKNTFKMIKDSFEVMLRDAYYDFGSVYQRFKIIKELNTFSFGLYNVRLTIESTRTDRETSKYIQVFNFISLIFFPITFVVNTFGCNIRVPWQTDLVDERDSRYFFLVMVICLIVLVLQQIIFKKLKWY